MNKHSISLPKTLQEIDLDSKSLSLQIKNINAREILSFFQSEEFTPELLIHYFLATFNEPGPHQYLVQKLYNMPNMFIEYFIPQFCYMVIKISSISMESFLEYLSAKSIANFFKIRWCINAYSEFERQDPISGLNICKLERRFEKGMVNAAQKFSKEEIMRNINNVEFQIQLSKQLEEKQPRAAYIGLVEKFLMNMIKLSLTLKMMEPPDRKPYLISEIKRGNKSIKKIRNSFPDLPYYWGISMPFQRKFEDQEASSLIVRICEDGCACFNTKTRVPYRILIETISPAEIEKKSAKFQQDASTDADMEDLFNREIADDFENQLRYHTMAKMEDECYKDLANFKSERQSVNDLDELESPTKSIPVQRVSTTSPKKVRRKSWSSTDEKQLTEGDSFKQTRQHRHLQSVIHTQPNSFQLLDEINQKEEDSIITDQNNQDRSKIVVKTHGPWGEDWDDKLAAIKMNSPFKEFESYQIRTIMVKGGDDLRQELLAMQLIQKFDSIFQESHLNIYLKPYEIIVTSENSGILEFVANTHSMDGLKKYLKKEKKKLGDFFKEYFGDQFCHAQRNFVESLVGYSLLTYLLQIKDRHNGNILIDNQGHLVHIDFGFILSISPGNAGFESAPFKLTQDYIDIMGGVNSRSFQYFRDLMFIGFQKLRKNCASIFQIIEIMMEQSNFHCFKFFKMKEFKERFKQKATDQETRTYVDKLIDKSICHWRTIKYDQFQLLTNGIEP